MTRHHRAHGVWRLGWWCRADVAGAVDQEAEAFQASGGGVVDGEGAGHERAGAAGAELPVASRRRHVVDPEIDVGLGRLKDADSGDMQQLRGVRGADADTTERINGDAGLSRG